MTGHTIKAVATRTGLSTHLIRMWERRYQAVNPERSSSNRRLYSDDDILRLTLLRQATDSGESIGQIANLPIDELQKLVAEVSSVEPRIVHAPGSREPDSSTPDEWVVKCLEAVTALDASRLEDLLLRATTALSQPVLLREVIEPLLIRIGEFWNEGQIRISHEHMASAVIRTMLGNLMARFQTNENAPRLVLATPAGSLHENGALMAAVVANSMGWHATYLGPNLPSEEIVSAALQNRVQAVALSVIYPITDSALMNEFRQTRRLLPKHVPILVGGKGMAGSHIVLKDLDIIPVKDLRQFSEVLDKVRRDIQVSSQVGGK